VAAAPGAPVSAVAGCLACGGELAGEPAVTSRDRMHGIPGAWPVHECLACGSGTTLPPAGEQELGAFYPRSYAPFEVPRGPVARAMAVLQRARDRRFPLSELGHGTRDRGQPGVLLDVGCGRGDLAASWLRRGWRVLGIEPSPDAAGTAARRGAEIVAATLSAASLEPESIDAVVFRHSLEHVVDPRLELKRSLTALRPGGRLAVIVPNWDSWQRSAFGDRWFPLELPRHRTHFSASGLRAAIAEAGFEGVDVRAATPFITTTWSLQFRLFDRLLTESGAALLAGYAASLPISVVSAALDARRGGGDFLHAAASKPG
jgi:SAM-dependent methyltransferase